MAATDGETRKYPHRDSPGFARSRSVVHPADGYTKAAMAQDIHALASKLGYNAFGSSGTTLA